MVQLNELTRTAGTIEAWNYILKKFDHSQKRLRPDVFLKEHYPLIIARQRQFFDDMTQPIKKRVKVSCSASYVMCYNYFLIRNLF